MPPRETVSDQPGWEVLTTWLEKELDALGTLPFSRDDLVSETLLRLLVVSQEEEIRLPFAYARTVLRNLVRDRLRELERARKALEELSLAAVEGTDGDGSAELLEDGECVRLLLESSDLSPLQRKVVELLYLADMRVTDVARELSKNPGTIQRHHDRALEKMARCAARRGIRA